MCPFLKSNDKPYRMHSHAVEYIVNKGGAMFGSDADEAQPQLHHVGTEPQLHRVNKYAVKYAVKYVGKYVSRNIGIVITTSTVTI
jgi:hypothetical protein